MTIVAIIASILLGGGLLPPYYEIWKRRGRVIGIDWVGRCDPRHAFWGSTNCFTGLSVYRLAGSIFLAYGTW